MMTSAFSTQNIQGINVHNILAAWLWAAFFIGGILAVNFDMLKVAAINAVHALWEGFSYKSVLAAVLALLLQKHAVLFYCFVALVFLDCFTKWMSISYRYLYDQFNPEGTDFIIKPTVVESIVGIKEARSMGLIRSDKMKHQFIGKIAVYLICAMAAALVDIAMKTTGVPTWCVALVVGYLVVTELLSIVENLNDSGIEVTRGLLESIKKKVKV